MTPREAWDGRAPEEGCYVLNRAHSAVQHIGIFTGWRWFVWEGYGGVDEWSVEEVAACYTLGHPFVPPTAAAAIRSLTPPPEIGAQAQWQPWGSAPENGTMVLVYRPDAGVFTAHYVEEDAHLASPMRPPEGDCLWFSTCGEDLSCDLPTHWMPLPAPPEDAR